MLKNYGICWWLKPCCWGKGKGGDSGEVFYLENYFRARPEVLDGRINRIGQQRWRMAAFALYCSFVHLYACLYITKCCFMTLFMGEIWLCAPQGLLCSCQQFPRCWWSCRFGGIRGDVLGPSHLSGDERAAEASLGCCLPCPAASIRPGTWCALFWGEEGEVHGQPCLQSVCVWQ